jgi:hypothetical protein
MLKFFLFNLKNPGNVLRAKERNLSSENYCNIQLVNARNNEKFITEKM